MWLHIGSCEPLLKRPRNGLHQLELGALKTEVVSSTATPSTQ
jgi:hypothetical protein